MSAEIANATEFDRRDEIQTARLRVWEDLAKVARPDARFHTDFSSFIPDFIGSDLAAERLAQLPQYAEAGIIFITPDNCLEEFRRTVITEGRTLLMTTHGIRRGFFLLDGARVAPEDVKHASTLDGFERYARAVTLSEIAALDSPVDLLVTGSSAIAKNGIRFGKGHGYFDLEWAMLSEVGAVSADSAIVAVGHDCQLVDFALTPEEHDVPVDVIVTPSATVAAVDRPDRPGAILWQILAEERVAAIPPLQELRALQALAR